MRDIILQLNCNFSKVVSRTKIPKKLLRGQRASSQSVYGFHPGPNIHEKKWVLQFTKILKFLTFTDSLLINISGWRNILASSLLAPRRKNFFEANQVGARSEHHHRKRMKSSNVSKYSIAVMSTYLNKINFSLQISKIKSSEVIFWCLFLSFLPVAKQCSIKPQAAILDSFSKVTQFFAVTKCSS